MKVSIIIPTYNEEKDLSLCLESLAYQTFKDFEIIVVDDGSTDNTQEVIKRLITSYKDFGGKLNIQYKIQNHKGAGAARNYGSKSATGDILVFVDADMTFDKEFLKILIAPILDSKSKGTFSKDEFVSNWDNIWARCWNINEGWEAKKRHPKNYPDTQPVFRAILKSEFDSVGGFTPGGYDDDWSLGAKLGYMAEAADGAVFYHRNPSSLSEVFDHAKWVASRKYKLGLVGLFMALIRALLPFSVLFGLYKVLVNGELRFLLFKVIYDLGIFVGILRLLIYGKSSK